MGRSILLSCVDRSLEQASDPGGNDPRPFDREIEIKAWSVFVSRPSGSGYTGSRVSVTNFHDKIYCSLLIMRRATRVPVGDDQRQHIEFTRYIANSFNTIYGPIFRAPEALICEFLFLGEYGGQGF